MQAYPKGLVEGTSLGQLSRVGAGEPIHDVLGGGYEIGDNLGVVGVISPLDVVKGDVVLCHVLYWQQDSWNYVVCVWHHTARAS